MVTMLLLVPLLAVPAAVVAQQASAGGTCNLAENPNVLKLVLDSTQTATLFENKDDTVATESLMVGRASNGLRHSLVRFNVPRLPSDVFIECAELELTVDPAISESSMNQIHQLFPVSEEWSTESQLPLQGTNGERAARGDPTWRYRYYEFEEWGQPGGDYAPDEILASQQVESTDKHYYGSTQQFREVVYDWVRRRRPHHGFLIKPVLDSPEDDVAYTVYKGSRAETKPRLYIFYTSPSSGYPHDTHPEPGISEDEDQVTDTSITDTPSDDALHEQNDSGPSGKSPYSGTIVATTAGGMLGLLAIVVTVVLTKRNVEGKVEDSGIAANSKTIAEQNRDAKTIDKNGEATNEESEII